MMRYCVGSGKHVIKGKIEGKNEGKAKGGKRRKQHLNGLKET